MEVDEEGRQGHAAVMTDNWASRRGFPSSDVRWDVLPSADLDGLCADLLRRDTRGHCCIGISPDIPIMLYHQHPCPRRLACVLLREKGVANVDLCEA